MKLNMISSNCFTFECDNKYSRLRFTNADRKLNKKRRREYIKNKRFLTFYGKLEKSKRLSWLKFLLNKRADKIKKSHRYQSLCSCFDLDSRLTTNDKNEKFAGDEIIPDCITIYDLLPKEFVGDFAKKYIAFRDNAIERKKDILFKTIKDIRDSFNKMATQFSIISGHNVDFFDFNQKCELSKYFKSLSISIRDISHSFLGISYTLELSDDMIFLFRSLLENTIVKSGHFINTGNKKSKSYAHTMAGSMFSKEQAIEDFICELKTQFLNTLKKNIFSKLDEMNIVLPNTIIYKCKNFAEVIKNNGKLISIGGRKCDLLFSKKENTYFQSQNLIFRNNKNIFNTTNIFMDESNFKKNEYGSINAYNLKEVLCNYFSLYYIIGAIMPEYDNRISETHKKMNILLSRKGNFGSLIKLKKETLKELLLLDRFVGELNEIGEDGLLRFICNYEFEKCNFLSLSRPKLPFEKLFHIALDHLSRSYNGILKIYDFFDNKLKAIEVHTNYRIVKWSLIVAACSLLVAAITFLCSNDAIINWFAKLFCLK